jgi:hypothetical protein
MCPGSTRTSEPNPRPRTLRVLAYAALCCSISLTAASASNAQGSSGDTVVAHTHLLQPASTSPKSTCAEVAPESSVVCVFLDWGGAATRVDLFEIDSTDGGVSWSLPQPITRNSGDEYDPFVRYDLVSKRLWLTYAKWHNDQGGQHNDVVARHKDCTRCAWSSPVVVAGDGTNDYWIPSILPLQDGTLLALYAKNGPESALGIGSGVIEVKHSADNGVTWEAPVRATDLCDAEYPRAAQNSFGSILLVFSRYVDSSHLPKGTRCADGMLNGYPYTDIHQVWSSDGGRTWKGTSTLYHTSAGSALHPFIGTESSGSQIRCATCPWDLFFVQSAGGGFAVFRMRSLDQGRSWASPMRFSLLEWRSPFNIDPGFVLGCRGLMVNYTSGYGEDSVYVQRDDGPSTGCAAK